jgi:hypothetical protein
MHIPAGKNFSDNSLLTTLVTLAVNYDDISQLQLGNYVYATSEDRISMAEFGIGMLYNHQVLSYSMSSLRCLSPTIFNTLIFLFHRKILLLLLIG